MKIFVDGSVYKGNFSKGFANGKGGLKKVNGYIYKGEWKDDKPNGKG